jgi:hypothetical protein
MLQEGEVVAESDGCLGCRSLACARCGLVLYVCIMLALLVHVVASAYRFCGLDSSGFWTGAGCFSGFFVPLVCALGGFEGGKLGEASLEAGVGVMTPFACLFL